MLVSELQLSSKICRQILENLRSQAIWFSDHCGFTAICIFTDARMKRYIGEKLDVHLIALLDDTFATENGMCGRAVRTCECGHVLDHTKNLYTMSAGVSGKTNIRCRTGTLTFRNISTPRTASLSATSCGVDTMTAPRTCQHVGNMVSYAPLHTVKFNLLRYSQLNVAGTWRKIKDEDIESTPLDFMQQLLKRLHNHETPPYDC
jgi:hypothetical protein